jgi:hypothetical protein
VNQFVEQAPVTNWPLRILLVGVVIAVIVLVVWAMWRGWKHRGSRQADIPPPNSPGTGPFRQRVDGLFLGTSRAGDWLDRIVVHGLGVPSRGQCLVASAGIAFERVGAPDFMIPATALTAVRMDRGVAGMVRERNSVLVLTWQLGSAQLECGFRPDDGDQGAALLDTCMAMVSR